jgi:hypothetical protein
MPTLKLFLLAAFIFYDWDEAFATSQYALWTLGVRDARIADATGAMMMNPSAYADPCEPEARARMFTVVRPESWRRTMMALPNQPCR